MSKDKAGSEGCWVSLILRLAVASLFAATAIDKFSGNLDSIVTNFQEMFKSTWLPMPLVVLHARLVPYLEALIPIWLLSGFRLKLGWVVTALFMVTLAFGMMVAKQYAVATNNYLYVMICCAGLYFSQFDTVRFVGK